jgi:hypothetical protein
MASEQGSLPGDRQSMKKINGAKQEAPSHMAIDAVTFNAVVKIISKLPWDEVNTLMGGMMSAQPVSLQEKQPVT